MALQVSAHILDTTVAPELSKLSSCGAKAIRRSTNQFSRYQMLTVLGRNKYKDHIHALLVVYFRRSDFARVEFNLGQKRLSEYVSKLPHHNSHTWFYRMALCHFETSLLHLNAAIECATTIANSLDHKPALDPNQRTLREFCNRIKHFNEDPIEGAKKKNVYQICPVWITNTGLKCQLNGNRGTIELDFSKLRELLKIVESECKQYCETLLEA